LLRANAGEVKGRKKQDMAENVVEDDDNDDVGESLQLRDNGHLLGNYSKYYEFGNSPDSRIQLFREHFLIGNLVSIASYCDLGCNSGELTYEMSLLCKPVRAVGVDIDQHLIQEAPFTLISCFATTMWIHLNAGDDGLQRFLKLASSKCRYLLIEPQPYHCYRRAWKRCRKLGLSLPFKTKDIKITRPEVFILEFLSNECSMNLVKNFGTTSWDRSIFLHERM